MTIEARIRIARERKGLTTQQAAERIGKTRQQWEQWETGQRTPNYGSLESIAGALDLTVPDLLTVEPAPKPEPAEARP